MKPGGIHRKTILFIVIATAVCVSGSVFMMAQIAARQAMVKYKADKETSMEVLTYALAPILSLYDFRQAENLLKTSLNFKIISSAAVYSDSGKLITSVAEHDAVKAELDIETRKITTDLEGIIGRLEVGFSNEYITANTRSAIRSLALALVGAFILLGLALYALMRKHIVKPLEGLTQTVNALTPDDLSPRATIIRNDEIGMLAGSFNQMAENLRISNLGLQESETKYRSMMEAMHDPVYICSADYRIEYMNPAMIRLLGRDGAGEACFRAVFNREAKCPWCRHDAVRQGESMIFDIVNPEDDQSYHASNAPIFHSDGGFSVLAVLRDTTQIRSLESQLMQAQKMESIGTLAGGIAHDFNNILSIIIGYADIALLDIPRDSGPERNLKNVLNAAERAKDLVKQILTFSRMSEEEKKPVQIQVIVKEALKFLRASLPSTIEIRQELETRNDTVLADFTKMHQILLNLCTNASQAMTEKGGVLTVRLENVDLGEDFTTNTPELEPGAYLKLSVSDTGHGMSPAVLKRIFEPYFTTKEKGSGTGLGMAVVHGIVKGHQGIITAQSEPGKGSRFDVYLPVIQEAELSKKSPAGPNPRGTERILLIDDEDDLVKLGKQMLEKLGYMVVTRTSSVEALALFRQKPDQFDLVITDTTMPNMTGDKLAEALIKINPDIAIIMCTGYSEEIVKEKALKMGVRAFVMKPVALHDLATIVRSVLDDPADSPQGPGTRP